MEKQQVFEKLSVFTEDYFKSDGRNPLLLEKSDAWLVVSEHVDIFAVKLVNGRHEGSWRQLFRVKQGGIIFGSAPGKNKSDFGLLAVGGIYSFLAKIPEENLSELCKQDDLAEELARNVDFWVNSFFEALYGEPMAEGVKPLVEPDKISLEEGDRIYAPDQPLWVQPKSGKYGLVEDESLTFKAKDLFPITQDGWAKVEETGEIQLSTSENIIADGNLARSLEGFGSIVAQCLNTKHREEHLEEIKRLNLRTELDKSLENQVWWQFASLLTRKSTKIFDSLEADAGPLVNTCKLIGENAGISFQFSAQMVSEPPSGMDGVEAIARASEVRFRSILLDRDWWKIDSGPLLTFRKSDGAPMALLPTGNRRYDLCDVETRQRIRVTPEIAETLEKTAIQFYRRFPERKLTTWEVIRFCLFGNARYLESLLGIGLLVSLLGLVVPYTTGLIFSSIIPEADKIQLLQIAVIIFSVALATSLLKVAQNLSMTRLIGGIDYTVQAAIWDRLLSLPVSFFKQFSSGDLANRSLCIIQIREQISQVFVQSVMAVLFSSANLLLIFYYDWSLGLMGCGLVLLYSLLLLGMIALILPYEAKLYKIQGILSGVVLQMISGITKIRSSGAENRALSVWAKDFREQNLLTKKSRQILNVLSTLNGVVPIVITMLFFWIVGAKIFTHMSIGNFLAFNAAFSAFFTAMTSASLSLMQVGNIVVLWRRAEPIFDTAPETSEGKSEPGQISGNIEMNHVNFRYRDDYPLVLRDVSMSFGDGEFVAITGSSGAGKSTLMRLLLGFDSPETGGIFYDGLDLEKIDPKELRPQIGVVLQNSRLIDGSIAENIIGSGNLTLDDAWEAARMSGCAEDIEEMPMKMFTVILNGGETLSGGQRQRILIARAVAKKPRVIIFDEATSALDNMTQSTVIESLKSLRTTRIVIAHRLSTIVNADRIYYMDKGKVVETGNYEELMSQDGHFAKFAQRQLG